MRISDWSSDVCSSDLPQQLGDDPIAHAAFDLVTTETPRCAAGVAHAGIGEALGLAVEPVRAGYHEIVPALVRRHLQPNARRIDVVASARTRDAAGTSDVATHAVVAVEPAETAPGTLAARP